MNIQKSINPDIAPLQLTQEVDTRWNSTYAMFRRFILLHTALNIILCEEKMPNNLTIAEWNFVECLTTVLEPIKNATEIMSGEVYPTLSQYYPMYFALISILQDHSTEHPLTTDICNSVRNALRATSIIYLNFETKQFVQRSEKYVILTNV